MTACACSAASLSDKTAIPRTVAEIPPPKEAANSPPQCRLRQPVAGSIGALPVTKTEASTTVGAFVSARAGGFAALYTAPFWGLGSRMWLSLGERRIWIRRSQVRILLSAPRIAQLGRASDRESDGRRFESFSIGLPSQATLSRCYSENRSGDRTAEDLKAAEAHGPRPARKVRRHRLAARPAVMVKAQCRRQWRLRPPAPLRCLAIRSRRPATD